MQVLVSGGTGFIGRALVARLLREGHSVSVPTRDPEAAIKILPPGVQVLDGNAPWPENCEAVIHLAGATLAHWPWSEKRKQILWRSRVDGTRQLVENIAAKKRRPAVLVHASGMGYYGDTGNREVHLGDPAGTDFLGRLAAAWEKEARVARELGLRVAILRQGMVLDRGGGALPSVALPFRLGLGAVFGSGRQYCPWIHLDDAIELFSRALRSSQYDGAFHAVAGEPLTQRDFARILASVLRRPLFFRAPEFALRLALGEMADLFLHGQRTECNAPGFQPRYPDLRAALTASF